MALKIFYGCNKITYGTYCSTQWAADTTYFSVTKVPPQFIYCTTLPDKK